MNDVNDNVIDMETRRAALCITGKSKNVHVIPVKTFLRVAAGEVDITVIEEWEDIVPTIVVEWLDSLKED